MPKRNPDSHKGENGKVLVIGGSPAFYGAPILAALGAQASGVDLVFPWLPPQHIEAAKTYSLNFILHHFKKEALGLSDVDDILKFSVRADAVIIGPGLEATGKTKEAIRELLAGLRRPTVVDAGALLGDSTLPAISVLTPHRGEFTRMTGDEPTPENVQKWAKTWKTTILCKGPTDIIANAHTIALNETGTPLMTVGGTGDVLSGLIAGLIAQKMEVMEACEYAANLVGVCGENWGNLQASLTAMDIVKSIPGIRHKNS